MTERGRAGPSRRTVLLGAGVAAGAAGALAGGFALGRLTDTAGEESTLAPPEEPVPAAGDHQAGIVTPDEPQANGLFVSYDVDLDSRAEVRDLLSNIGTAVIGLTTPGSTLPGVTDDGPGDLTVTVGIGPRLVTIAGRDLPGSTALPRFDGDGEIPERARGGDLLLAIQASDATVLDTVRDHLQDRSPQLSPRWQQRGFRGGEHPEPGVARNVIGYLDGIIVPRTVAELDTNVWIASGPAQGGTICVLRRLVVDVDRFRAETDERQDDIIGRHRVDGSPLSGGGTTDQIDLTAKTPDGEYQVPAHAHARAAHPSFTGSATMLRGSYTFDEGERNRGTLFRCFQRDLDTFVKTQRRLDEVDDLMGYVRLTATGSFLILPGYGPEQPLGSSLFG